MRQLLRPRHVQLFLAARSYRCILFCCDTNSRARPAFALAGFRSFFCTAQGWGMLSIQQGALVIELVEGELRLDKLHFRIGDTEGVLTPGVTASAGKKIAIPLGQGK